MRWPVALLLLAAAIASVPVSAREADLAVPSGRLSDVAIAVARATGSSIVVSDPALARRKVAGVRGRMDAGEAVRQIARVNGLRAVKVGPGAWRLVAAPPARRPGEARRAARRAQEPRLIAQAESGAPIIVIASKRGARIDQLPAQVSILEGKELERGGIGGTEKLTQRIATVSSTYLGSGRNKLFIRGIADSSFTGPTQATVGQYLGDLRLSYNAPDPDLRLSDLERVEVLEGPQGTLYGAGSLGGIIRLVPRSAQYGETSLSLMSGGSATQHGEPGADVHATLNLPITQSTAALRLNFDYAAQGGYIDKPQIGRNDVNRTHILAGRAALQVELSPDWTAELLAIGQDTDAHDSQYADREGKDLESSALVEEGSSAKYGQVQFVVSGYLGAVRLRSSTGISGQDLSERYDASEQGGETRLFVQRNNTRMIANETRIWQPFEDSFGWLLGASFIDNRTSLTRLLGPQDEPVRTTGVRNTVEETTGYGEASLRLFGPLIASAGLRITRAKLGGAGEDVALSLAIAGAAITAQRSETALLPSASLLAELGSGTRLYARYQEGFRPGGLAISGDFVRQFRSDHTRTVEIGAGTGEPGRGSFDLSANLSFTRWRDIQADFIDDTGLPTTSNIGDGRIWTASVSGSAAIAADARLEFGASYNKSKVDEPIQIAFDRISQIPNIARFSGRLGLSWSHELGSDLTLDANGWASYVGKSRLGIGPELGELQGGYLDSGLILRVGRKNIGLSISLTNLADVEGNRFALGTPFSTGREQITPLTPRTLRIGLDSRF